MKNNGKSYLSKRLITGFMVLSIALIAFLTYIDIIGYFFTATDTLPLIDTGRIQSFNDIVRIFTEPMMNGTKFVKSAVFYRPISTLSFSLDYFIWKLNPFGYHLTNLILHILVSVVVFFLVRFLTNGKQVIAWLSAILFTTHPILVEVVPATSTRQDTISTLFVLLSLLFFLKSLSPVSRKRGYLLFSLFSYILALGTKEIMVILPFLIFTYLFTVPCSDKKYFKDRSLHAVKRCLPHILVTLLYLFWRTYILQGIGGYFNMPLKGPITILKSYFVALLYPVDFLHLGSRFDVIPYKSLLSFFIITLIGIHQRHKIKNFFITSAHGKLIVFLVIWIFLPLGIYICTLTFSHRYMYFSVIPFSSILSIMLVGSFQSTVQRIRESSLINSTAVSFLIIAGLSVSLISYSPLVRSYREWEASANLSSSFLHRLSGIITELPNEAVIHIYNLPIFVLSSESKNHHVRQATTLQEYSIKSWLDLNYPNNHIEVVSHEGLISADPDDLDLEIKIVGDNKAEIIFIHRVNGNNST